MKIRYTVPMLDTQKYKVRLISELKTVTEELASLGIHNPEVDEDWIALAENTEVGEADSNIMADKNEDLANRDAIVADLETQYNIIKHALKKIELHTYGICEVSGEPIEPERLDANPAARTCIKHLDQEESLV